MELLRRVLKRSARASAPAGPRESERARDVPLEPRTCPYCLSRFARSPLQDLDCPACGEHVWVMRDRETGGRLLLTKEQAEALREEDEALLRAASGHGVRERWLRELEESHGVLAADFERERRGPGDEAGERAVVWRLLDLLAEQKKDYAELVDVYERRARFADECDQDFTPELRRARALELLRFKKEGDVEYVRIRAGGCNACARADGVRLPLERAMHAMPLPLADCACPAPHSARPRFCTGRYERDLKI
jgi:hypothetical protein